MPTPSYVYDMNVNKYRYTRFGTVQCRAMMLQSMKVMYRCKTREVTVRYRYYTVIVASRNKVLLKTVYIFAAYKDTSIH